MALEDDEEQPQPQPPSVLTLFTEIIVEILLRLPIDSILRCKSVCKSWRSLISDPRFINSHLTRSTTNNNHHRLMLITRRKRQLKSCPLYDSLYNKSIHALTLDALFLCNRTRESVWVVGSCNGLICIAVDQGVMSKALFIWNPSTRRSNRLPNSGHTGRRFWTVHYGFGYDESSNDYKVVEIGVVFTERFKKETSVEIYSLRSGSWKNVGGFCYGMPQEFCATFMNGALHWAANKDFGSDFSASVSETDEDGVPIVTLFCDWSIICFDLGNETYGEVPRPKFDDGVSFMDLELELGRLREWLCVVSSCRGVCANLWVMKVYGVKDSWVKLVSIPYITEPEAGRYSVPLCISNDGKVLVTLGSKLIVYDAKNGSFSEKQNCAKVDQASTFVESLVSPMPLQLASASLR